MREGRSLGLDPQIGWQKACQERIIYYFELVRKRSQERPRGALNNTVNQIQTCMNVNESWGMPAVMCLSFYLICPSLRVNSKGLFTSINYVSDQ